MQLGPSPFPSGSPCKGGSCENSQTVSCSMCAVAYNICFILLANLVSSPSAFSVSLFYDLVNELLPYLTANLMRQSEPEWSELSGPCEVAISFLLVVWLSGVRANLGNVAVCPWGGSARAHPSLAKDLLLSMGSHL